MDMPLFDPIGFAGESRHTGTTGPVFRAAVARLRAHDFHTHARRDARGRGSFLFHLPLFHSSRVNGRHHCWLEILDILSVGYFERDLVFHFSDAEKSLPVIRSLRPQIT